MEKVDVGICNRGGKNCPDIPDVEPFVPGLGAAVAKNSTDKEVCRTFRTYLLKDLGFHVKRFFCLDLQLAESLAKLKDVKVLHFSSMEEVFRGWVEKVSIGISAVSCVVLGTSGTFFLVGTGEKIY